MHVAIVLETMEPQAKMLKPWTKMF
jgi:hypothetical protein